MNPEISPIEKFDKKLLSPDCAEFVENFAKHIIYEDEDMLAINKPPRLPSHIGAGHPYGVEEVLNRLRDKQTHIVHRLDLDTSGLILAGKTPQSIRELQRQFAHREVEKAYVALVDGDWNEKIAGIIAPLEKKGVKVRVKLESPAKKAVTAFDEIAELRQNDKIRSLLKVQIYTGRTHQIRAHLKHLEFPITGDRQYNFDKYGFKRQLLHSYEIKFSHPRTHEDMDLKAPLTTDFRRFVSGMDVNQKTEEFERLMGE